MDKVDIVYYINLDHRTDRREEFLEWITESGFSLAKVQRIQAVYVPVKGYLGCLLSHMKTLEAFILSPHTNCIIFEDDYTPLDVANFWTNIEKIFQSKVRFDVVLCAYCMLKSEETEHSFLHKVHASVTTSGYIITKEYAPILLEHWHSCLCLCMREENAGRCSSQYTADNYWQELMPIHNWYTFYPRLGIQRPSYSDIEQENLERNV